MPALLSPWLAVLALLAWSPFWWRRWRGDNLFRDLDRLWLLYVFVLTIFRRAVCFCRRSAFVLAGTASPASTAAGRKLSTRRAFTQGRVRVDVKLALLFTAFAFSSRGAFLCRFLRRRFLLCRCFRRCC